MLYSDFVNLSSSTSADTLSTSGNITLNGKCQKILAVWAAGGDQTLTAAEACAPYFDFTGDVGIAPTPSIPLSVMRSGGLAPIGANVAGPDTFPVNWQGKPNGVVTVQERGAASTGAELYAVGLIYSDGESLPYYPYGMDMFQLAPRGPPKYVVQAAPTSVTATTETSVGTLTVPGTSTQCVGLTVEGNKNGVVVTAEEFLGTCRYSATGATGAQFEPAQNWPFFGQLMAGLGTIIDAPSVERRWHPLQFGVTNNSTITARITLRTAISNATRFQVFGAFV